MIDSVDTPRPEAKEVVPDRAPLRNKLEQAARPISDNALRIGIGGLIREYAQSARQAASPQKAEFKQRSENDPKIIPALSRIEAADICKKMLGSVLAELGQGSLVAEIQTELDATGEAPSWVGEGQEYNISPVLSERLIALPSSEAVKSGLVEMGDDLELATYEAHKLAQKNAHLNPTTPDGRKYIWWRGAGEMLDRSLVLWFDQVEIATTARDHGERRAFSDLK